MAPTSQKTESLTVTSLRSLMELASLVNSSLDPAEVRRLAVETVPRCVSADAASLLLLDGETGELYFEAASGVKGQCLKEVRLRPGEGIAGWVARKGGAVGRSKSKGECTVVHWQ